MHEAITRRNDHADGGALDGERVTSEPLVALRGVPKGGLWRQLVDEIRLLIAR